MLRLIYMAATALSGIGGPSEYLDILWEEKLCGFHPDIP